MNEPGEYAVHVVIEGLYQVDEEALREASRQALSVAGAAPPLGLTVTITSEEAVHELNRRYAGIDSTTDVLAFGAEDEPYLVDPDEPPYLGDVIIAYPVAEKQAAEMGHPTLTELQVLAIHGTLHLLGYDHATPDQQAEMKTLEAAAMERLRATGA
ncbi:MAG TPA: rRNA maturation RNase YbeY [Chloroflexi bacterium]|nr:rRNA maturation RNase YbeY [Chloroflexota bacterium]